MGGLVLLLAACTVVGPDYRLPEQSKINAPAARQDFQGRDPSFSAYGEVPGRWWQLYRDAQLNQLVEEALAANTDLRMAAANLARSEAISMEAEGARHVKLSASGTAVRARESGEAYLVPERLPVESLGDGGINIAYQIDLVGGLKRAAEAAAADVEASHAALDLARISIVADLVFSYTEACAAGHELEVAQRSLELQEQSQVVVARLVANGRGMAVDLPRARHMVEQTRSAIPAHEARRRVALYKVAVLTGHPPGGYPPALANCRRLPQLQAPIPVGDGAALLRRRPDVRQAERALAGATARVGVATAALYPTVKLGFSAGATGILEHMGQSQTQRWSIGPLISWTLPGDQEKARLRQADAGMDGALAHFDAVVLNALREVESALTVLARDLDRRASLGHARDEAAKAGQQVEMLYRAGRLPYMDHLDAQRSLVAAEAALAASEAQVAADQVKLFLALGGGWGDVDARNPPAAQ